MSFIELGKKEGAKLLLGGDKLDGKGFFIQPTIFSEVTDDMTIAREEIFGPVMNILKFDDYEDVIKRANNTYYSKILHYFFLKSGSKLRKILLYGLVAGIVTKSIDLYQAIGKKIRAGSIYVNTYDIIDANTPYGGFKGSGLGRELGKEGLESYLEIKTCIVPIKEKL